MKNDDAVLSIVKQRLGLVVRDILKRNGNTELFTKDVWGFTNFLNVRNLAENKGNN